MKVLYLCSAHQPYDKRVYYKISKSLSKKQFEVTSLHPNVKEEITLDNIKIVSFDKKEGVVGRLTGLYNMFKKGKAHHADIIIAPEPDSLFVGFILKKIDKNKNLKVIFDCHEWYEIHFKDKLKNKFIEDLLNKSIEGFLGFISKRIDGVLTVNETMKNKYLLYNKNSYCIPNTLSVSKKVEKKQEKAHFIFSGNFCDHKQEKILIETAKILKERNSRAKIRILGGYPNDIKYVENFKKFNDIIKGKEIIENIELVPWMDFNDAKEFVNSHLVGITRFDSYLYGQYHCLPNKIFDYMAAELAVITCELNKETSQIITENKCGIAVKEENAENLADAIIFLYENQDIAEQMSENAFNAMERKYSWEKYEKEIARIFKAI